jgi:hypothetical protein
MNRNRVNESTFTYTAGVTSVINPCNLARIAIAGLLDELISKA